MGLIIKKPWKAVLKKNTNKLFEMLVDKAYQNHSLV